MNGLPAWSPNAIALSPDPTITQRWTGSISMISTTTPVAAGTTINFKVTRGGWNTVEKGPLGEEVANRVAIATSGPTTVLGHVFHWGDDQILPPAAPIRDLGVWEPRGLGLPRQIYAHLPPGYDVAANSTQSYPVLYCLDGQRLFDPTRSPSGKVIGMDVAADGNATAGHGSFIVVGIDATSDRTNEYGPSYDPTVQGGGKLDQLSQWLVDELKPEIDRAYRTQPGPATTGIFGCELGGLAAFRMAWSQSSTIQVVGSLSPLMGWSSEETKGIVASTASMPPLRIWLDVGTNEGSNPQAQLGYVQNVDQALLGIGFFQYVGGDLSYTEVQGGTADETAWAARLPDVLAYLFR